MMVVSVSAVENVASVEVLPMTNPTANERKTIALAVGCEFGLISHERVVNSLSRYVSESVARKKFVILLALCQMV